MASYKIVTKHDDINALKKTIIPLWQRNLLPWFSEPRFKWLYEQNPNGPVKTWFAYDPSGDNDLGCNSLCPVTVLINGRKAKIGVAIDFAVNKEARVFGPALTLVRAVSASARTLGFEFTMAYPTKYAEAVFKRAGYKVLGKAENWVHLLSCKGKLKDYVKLGILAVAAGFVLESFFEIADTLFMLLYTKGHKTEILDKADRRFDDLWERARSQYSIISEKNSEYLNWRYSGLSGENNSYFCIFGKDGRLDGYVVYSIKENISVVYDLFTFKDGSYYKDLLANFDRQMKKDRIESITMEFLGGDELRKSLKKLFYLQRPLEKYCYLHFEESCKCVYETELMNPESWFIMHGDLDI